jgi:glycosyltransferase involved in cell wall biosynthesis
LTIGTVAGLRPEKNVARLIRAFRAVRARREAQLVIVGDGPDRSTLEALARQLGVDGDVTFAGYQTNPMQWLGTFDLFALSSDTEQLPISMLEAMACGIPVVATRVGDVPEVMPAVATGALADPEDGAFADTLQWAIERRSEWPRWVEAGYERLESQYKPESMIAEWQRLFDGRWD